MFLDIYADIVYEQLENGLSVYVKEWPSASWFYTGVVIHAGAREDPAGRAGLAHLVEHLVGENVAGLTFSQLEKRFRELGGSAWFGSTSYACSEYTFHLPNEERNIYQALDLFGQMLLLPKELKQKIEEEKKVLLREYHRDYEHEQARCWALQGRPWLFEQHPCLRSFHTAIGVPDEFLASSQQDIQAFYETYYVPQNCSVVGVGALSRHRFLQLLAETPFALSRAGQRHPLPAPFFPRPPRKQMQIIHLSDYSQFVQWEAEISFEWVVPLSFEKKCVQILCDLCEERLTEELRYSRHLTYAVEVRQQYYQDCRTMRIDCKTAPDAVEHTQDLFWRVLKSLDQEEEKYREIKQELLARIYRMDYAGYDLLESAMGDLASYHRLISFREEIEQVMAVSFEQVSELAHYLSEERHFCWITLP